MRLLKPLQNLQVGLFRLVVGLALLSMAILNISSQLRLGLNILKGWYMTIPFVLSIFVVYKTSIKKSLSWLCLMAALYSAFNQNAIGDYSASIFFVFSFHTVRHKFYGIFLLFISVISLSLNATILDSRANVVIALLVAYSTVYLLYYFLIYKQPKQIKNIDILKEEEKAISKLYCAGCSYENISKTLSLNILPSTVRRRIKEIKDLNGINNDAQFGKWLYDLV